jgi:hypothetical protein
MKKQLIATNTQLQQLMVQMEKIQLQLTTNMNFRVS